MAVKYAGLHVHLSRQRRQEWHVWASSLREGTSFFCSAIANVDPRGRLVTPLNSDLKDLEVIKTAYANAVARLKKGWKNPESHVSSEKQRMRVLGNRYREVKANVEGSGVTVWSSGKVAFLWNLLKTKPTPLQFWASRRLSRLPKTVAIFHSPPTAFVYLIRTVRCYFVATKS